MSSSNARVLTPLEHEQVVTGSAKTVRDAESLVERVQDAHKALAILSLAFKGEWNDFVTSADARLTEFRQVRMSTETEIHRVMTDLKDVRKFFMSEDHDKEVARLKEFVELCERLKALKESGFLDKVSDTILRLEVKP